MSLRDPVILAEDLTLSYGTTKALTGASLSVLPGEVLVLTGKSGSGKTSLLYCLSGIVRPDSGRVMYGDHDIVSLGDDELSRLRREDFGFVFQFGELVPELSITENVELPLRLAGMHRRPARARSEELLASLDISEVADKRPSEVSGGQAQRAAVARALVHRPSVIFADEPTGALDAENRAKVLEAFLALARTEGTAVILVTHEEDVASAGDRRVMVSDGRITEPAAR